MASIGGGEAVRWRSLEGKRGELGTVEVDDKLKSSDEERSVSEEGLERAEERCFFRLEGFLWTIRRKYENDLRGEYQHYKMAPSKLLVSFFRGKEKLLKMD